MIEVTHDGESGIGEACCFCRRSTHYWYTTKDVAVCQACAEIAEHKDVPTKKTWFRREEIVTKARFVRLKPIKLHATVYRVRCPTCNAEPDTRCRTLTGGKPTDPHASRRK